jgi:glucosamine-6-phosphate deaminase
MKVKIYDDYKKLSIDAALEFINLVRKKGDCTLGLATGSSPIGIYQEIIKDHKENHTTYKNVVTFNLDEYIGIDKNHNQSYNKFMQNVLFQYIDIDPKNVNIPNGATDDVNLECEVYNRKLAQRQIDIQLLGIGGNGHIGFNEPGTPFDSVTHHIELDENTRLANARFFETMDKVPTHAITMGIKNILDTKKIILVATGINKADAVYSMINGPIDPISPASSLQLHKNVIVFLDKEAASKL